MEEIKISVIIPVYNTLRFLDKCLRSILDQSLREIEVILIDDGSDDGSYERCLEYAAMDARVSTARQSHLRASAARNNGLRRARGRYVMFADSDDYLAPGALETLWAAVLKDDLDVVRASLYVEDDGGVRRDARRDRIRRELMSGADFFRHVVEVGAYSCSVVLGLYRREMLTENRLFFLEGHATEDELWTPSMLLAAGRVRYVDLYFYYHVMHEDSVMHTKDLDRHGRDLVTVARALAEVPGVPRELERIWYDNMLGKYFSGFCIGRMYRGQFRDLVSKRFPIRYVRSPKNFARTLVYLLNYRLFVWLNTRAVQVNRARGVVRS